MAWYDCNRCCCIRNLKLAAYLIAAGCIVYDLVIMASVLMKLGKPIHYTFILLLAVALLGLIDCALIITGAAQEMPTLVRIGSFYLVPEAILIAIITQLSPVETGLVTSLIILFVDVSLKIYFTLVLRSFANELEE